MSPFDSSITPAPSEAAEESAASEQPSSEHDVVALDEYLQRLHAGEPVDREEFGRRHPNLSAALDCLDQLDKLAESASDVDSQVGLTLRSGDHVSSILVVPPSGEFGGFEILSEVGRGGMGVVFRARQKALDRVVALKIIATSLASPEQVRRFHLEAQAAAKLRHPNIVAIHEVGESYGQHYLAMEFISGQTLADRLKDSPVPIDEAVGLLVAIARAVDHFHHHGVIHRDLKPSNILLDQEGTPYVADFGLAKFFEAGDRTDTGVIAGTPSYMSPEQACGRSAEVGPASDVYSLGAILYELLTGRPPFKGENNLVTLLQVRDREAELPRQLNPKVPSDLELICLRCLEKSPPDRYQSAAELADDLESFLRGEAVAAKPWGTRRRLWRWARREPALATRFVGVTLFYLVELFNYVRGAKSTAFHLWVTAVLALWVLVSFVLQKMLRRRRRENVLGVQAAWCVTDVASLAAVLIPAGGVSSPAVLAYPLLIVSAGLWFRVRLVWLMTGMTTLAYLAHAAMFYWGADPFNRPFERDFDRHVYFVLSLLICGCLTAYHVWRVRVLTQYYDRHLKRGVSSR